MDTPSPAPVAMAHYAYVTRRLIDLFATGRLPAVSSIDVEPAYGYLTRLTYRDGGRRITYGNDLGVDAASSVELARDKGHTKHLLREMGVRCPRGREFLLPWWAESIRATHERRGNTALVTIDLAAAYVEADLGYPVYVKPVAGTKGEGVVRVGTPGELEAALVTLDRDRARVAVVEEAIDLPDHRIVTFDGELVCAYRRLPLHLVGDGHTTLGGLLRRRQRALDRDDRDTRLPTTGLALASIPDDGQVVTVSSLANLAAGGTAEDVTGTIHPRWVHLAGDIADACNLRLCGTDLLCADIADPTADHAVLEVNATPGLEHFAASGPSPHRTVDDLYARVLNTTPGTTGRQASARAAGDPGRTAT